MSSIGYFCSNKRNLFYIVFLIQFICVNAFGQPLVTIPNTFEISFKSTINEQEYILHVAIPKGYRKSLRDYPVVYLLDGNDDFPLVTSISRRLQREGELNLFIVVGIGYQYSPGLNRRSDFTPSNAQGVKNSGGANKFIEVIEKEIIPRIEINFRTSTNDRALLGNSLGGLFAAHLILNDSKLFNSYIISSPSMWWDSFTVLVNRSKIIFSSQLNIYLTVGALENSHMIESWEKLSKSIDLNLSSANKNAVQLRGENHNSAKFRAYADGLRWLFNKST